MTRDDAITTLAKIQKLLAIYPKRKKQKESVNEIETAIGMAIEALKTDRPHGEWLYRWNDVECSRCGEFEKGKTNFCPNCGADMRGGDTE